MKTLLTMATLLALTACATPTPIVAPTATLVCTEGLSADQLSTKCQVYPDLPPSTTFEQGSKAYSQVRLSLSECGARVLSLQSALKNCGRAAVSLNKEVAQ